MNLSPSPPDACAEAGRLDAAALARRIGELPPLPRALAEAMRVMGSDALSTAECVAVIEHDTTLAARVLQLANSAFYGAPGKVGSISEAVHLLGLRTVVGVVAAISLRQMLGRLACPGFDFDAYWVHTLGTALTARELAARRDLDAEEAFLAGLLHDVGRLVLAVFRPGDAARAIAQARAERMDSVAAEGQILGVSHDEVGATVARHWNFPMATLAAIAHHHAPPTSGEDVTGLAAVVHVADALAQGCEALQDASELAAAVSVPAWRAMRLTDESTKALMQRVQQGVAALRA